MTITRHRRVAGTVFAMAVALPLAACGEDDTEAVGDTFLPNRSEEHLIDGVKPADQVVTERKITPQATTGGEIPGYSPVDKNEGVPIGDDTTAAIEADEPVEAAPPAEASGDPLEPVDPIEPVAPIRPVE